MILLLAFSLGVDAFAVATSYGIKNAKGNKQSVFYLAFSFGIFQAAMAGAGAALSEQFGVYVDTFGALLASIILLAIGGKMLWEAFSAKDEEAAQRLDVKRILLLSLATSIDAFAAGIGLRFLTSELLLACVIIGITAYAMALVGVLFGQKLGTHFQKRATVVGALVLIVLGIHAFFG